MRPLGWEGPWGQSGLPAWLRTTKHGVRAQVDARKDVVVRAGAFPPEGWDDEHRAFSPEWILTIFPYYSVTWEELKAPEQMRPLTEGGPDSKGPGPSAAWGHPLLHCASAVSEARWDIEALGDAVQRRGAGSEAEGTVVFGSWPCLGETALRGRGHASPPRGAA